MLNKITEPQAMYEKEHQNSAASVSSGTNTRTAKKQWKIVGGALAAVLFLVVGVAGVLVSQRQQQVAGPVAPNAPASQPKAAADTPAECKLTFTVAQPPPPPPVSGAAQCGTKEAYLVKADLSLEKLGVNAVVTPGSVIEYRVPVSATAATDGEVKLLDTLDANTTFLPSGEQPTSDADAITHAAGKVTITFGKFDAAGQRVAKYRVKVAAKVQPFTFTNTVTTTDMGNGQKGTQNCSIALKTTPTGTASCKEKTAYTVDAANKVSLIGSGDTVIRGSEYYYSIKIQATGKIPDGKTVTVKDTLPVGITLVENDSKNTPGLTKEVVSGREVITKLMPSTFGEKATEGNPEVAEIIFKVKIAASVAPGSFNNTVAVTTGTTTDNTCKHIVEVKPDGVAQCIDKQMHNAPLSANKEPSATLIADNTNLDRNSEFYYRIRVKADRITTGKVTMTDAIPAALEVLEPGIFKLENGKYVASYDAFQGEKTAEIKVKVKSGYYNKIDNVVSVTTAGSTSTASNCSSSFNIPSYGCNLACDNDEQCKTVDSGYSCAATSEGKRCRLTANTSSVSCSVATTPTPTPTPTPPTVSTPTPTPTIGCNAQCTTNADCSNAAHICYQTNNGGRCRLDTNVTSVTCTSPVAQTTPTPQQPVPPQELPKTGPEDWGNWLKAGLVTLGIGAVLLLLL
jgi:hypothetical protein